MGSDLAVELQAKAILGVRLDVLQVLEEAGLSLVLGLGGHEGDLLDLALKDEEAVVVEVDALLLERRVTSLKELFLSFTK